jgi:hypothetical protein
MGNTQSKIKKSLLYAANAIPRAEIIASAGSIRKIEYKESKNELLTLDNCHEIPEIHSSRSPANIAYMGQISGIKITGINHKPRKAMVLLDLYSR